MAEDKFLQDYIKKLMERENSLGSLTPLTDEQLKQVALDTGMTETDWSTLKADAQSAEIRGFEHLKRGNFEDALAEFKESTSLYPNSSEALYGTAKALFKKGVEKEDKTFLDEAILYTDRVLTLNSSHGDALDLRGHIRKHKIVLGDKLVTKGKIGKWKKWLIPAIPIVILLFWFIGTYNSVIILEEDTQASWAQVENVYETRHDKIGQLVKVVKSATKQEEKVLKEVISARNMATRITVDGSNLTPEQLSKYAESQSKLSSSLGKLIAVAEQYPTLKSMDTYLTLQDEIAESENKIEIQRRKFNNTIQKFNNKVKRFPAVLLPFSSKPYYEVAKEKMGVPELDL